MPPGATDLAVSIERLNVSVLTVPTDGRESDGTMERDATTVVLVEARAGDETGLGWTYGSAGAASVIEEELALVVVGRDALSVGGAWRAMRGSALLLKRR